MNHVLLKHHALYDNYTGIALRYKKFKSGTPSQIAIKAVTKVNFALHGKYAQFATIYL